MGNRTNLLGADALKVVRTKSELFSVLGHDCLLSMLLSAVRVCSKTLAVILVVFVAE